ncbi:MAG: hypothetical protein AB1295_05295 [Candidatus Micrarchaeota archaeon]
MDIALVARKLEYDDSTASLVIREGSSVLLKKELPDGTPCVTDSVCSEGEDAFSCPSDCDGSSQDGYCTGYPDSLCDPDCSLGTDPDCLHDGPCCLPACLLLVLAMRIGIA